MMWTDGKAMKDKLLFVRMSELAMGKIINLPQIPRSEFGILQEDLSHDFPPI